jgi:hypothetical protein
MEEKSRLNKKEVMAVRDEERRHIQAQIKRLRADADRHKAIADELATQAECLVVDLDYEEKAAETDPVIV